MDKVEVGGGVEAVYAPPVALDFRVRPAERGDIEDLADLHVRSWRWAYRGLLPDAYLRGLRRDVLAGRWFLRLASQEADEAVLVLDVEGTVGGFLTFGPHRDDPTWLGYAGEISMLYLAPELVGRGFGRVLLHRAFEELTRCQCYWVVLWVLARNERARHFYEGQQLRPDGGQRWDPFGNQAVPVVRYARALNPVVDFADLYGRSLTRGG